MKHIICCLAAFILMLPPAIIGCITYIISAVWEFKFGYNQFLKGSQWLDVQYNYGKLIENLLER
jgi:hypothetical protein